MSDNPNTLEADCIEGVASPQGATRLIGHAQVYDLLVKQLSHNTLPSGLLIHGPKGVGKASLAFCLARQIFLQTGDEPSSRVDEQVFNGVHPNLYVLRRVVRERGSGFYNEIRVDEVRSVLRKLHQTRGRAGHRILIVDAIDDCNVNAANALLKTLEEPPADTHIVLISHRPGRLLPTIRSRCQAHSLRMLPKRDVQEILQAADINESDIAQAVTLANGRPRRGFEATHIGNNDILLELDHWLGANKQNTTATSIKIAEFLADKKHATELSFAREMLLDWIAKDIKNSATTYPKSPHYLASANRLWEKANQLFEQTDRFNLDGKQSLISLFDQIFMHEQKKTTATN